MKKMIMLQMLIVLLSFNINAADWPMWRMDANRSAFTPEEVPEKLELKWVREFSKPRTAWPKSQYKLQFDAGSLYCLNNQTGKLIKRIQLAPDSMNIIGNDRVISMWPVRGAPVIDKNGALYCAAGIWPFMGTFIYSINADTLEEIWCNSGSGSTYTLQQHNTPAFAGVAPQGYSTVSGNIVLISGGRTNPAAYDSKTGEFIYFPLHSRAFYKSAGGFGIQTTKNYFLTPYGVYDIKTGLEIGFTLIGVCDGKNQYYIYKNRLYSVSLDNLKIDKKSPLRSFSRRSFLKKNRPKTNWRSSFTLDKIFLKAGNKIFGNIGNKILSIKSTEKGADIVWEYKLKSKPFNMILSDGKLFVSTEAGKVLCFGKNRGNKIHKLCSRFFATNTPWDSLVWWTVQ